MRAGPRCSARALVAWPSRRYETHLERDRVEGCQLGQAEGGVGQELLKKIQSFRGGEERS